MTPPLTRAGLVPGALLSVLLVACSTASPTRAPGAPAEESTSTPARPEPDASALEAACGDTERFRQLVREAVGPASGTGAPNLMDAERLARVYLDRCGLAETVELTSRLIEFPTVSAREPPSNGPAFRAMAEYLRNFAEKSGLDFRVFGPNEVWEMGYGRGPSTTAFVVHADVVPIDDGLERRDGTAVPASMDAVTGEPLPPGWSKAPFRGTIADGKLYGRGSEDDKGPLAATLVVLRTLARFEVPTAGRVLLVIGTSEESDWSGMRRYVEATPAARYVISLDASFPVVTSESGFVAWQLAAPMKGSPERRARGAAKACTVALDAHAGQFLTQVPGEAKLTLSPSARERPEQLLARVKQLAEDVRTASSNAFRFRVEPDGPRVRLTAYGDAVHSSEADRGHNALWALARVGAHVGLCPSGLSTMLRVLDERMVDDHLGQKLGLAYTHGAMGPLLVTPTLLRVDAEQTKLSINMRRPAGMSTPAFQEKLDAALALLKKDIDAAISEVGERYVGEPAIAETDGPLVPTLLDIYRKETGDSAAQPLSIRGGTYARLFPGAVSFGPSLPGHPYRGHAPDESIELDALALMGRSIFSAIVALDAYTLRPPPVATGVPSRGAQN